MEVGEEERDWMECNQLHPGRDDCDLNYGGGIGDRRGEDGRDSSGVQSTRPGALLTESEGEGEGHWKCPELRNKLPGRGKVHFLRKTTVQDRLLWYGDQKASPEHANFNRMIFDLCEIVTYDIRKTCSIADWISGVWSVFRLATAESSGIFNYLATGLKY